MENYLYLLIPLCAGWLLDRRFGDPLRLPHPVAGFGRLIVAGDRRHNRGNNRFWKGAGMSILLITGTFVFTLILYSILGAHIVLSGAAGTRASIVGLVKTHFTSIIPLAFFLLGKDFVTPDDPSGSTRGPGFIVISGQLNIASMQYWTYILFASVPVFYCLAGKTLVKEVREVFRACDRSLEDGRRQVGRIVGRDTSGLSGQEVRTAALETLSENLSDGVIAPLFWYVLLGVPGMVTYKMINTLDSMIGYRSERYLLFGRFAAIIDDFANFIPARLTAVLMITVSGKWSLFPFIIKYGNKHLSPNSGYPEAALAGILDCRFGGPHRYFGETVDKPYIGTNERMLTRKELDKAVKNARYTEVLAVIICIAVLSLVFL
ncbi:MAG: adenosylcobinamide-phosphate synthase CbiB [Tannerella sp.]|jgi:adenosylcobinamide-phosphate synthase|nr:adenosylcobinamide-phosphate synthase CbiB [Tannerella sp.]